MSTFQFRDFSVRQSNAALKVGTDAMVFGSLLTADNPREILDVGAGTGVLSLMMAQKFPDANINAIEIDDQAILDVQFNFENAPFTNRLYFVKGDFTSLDFNQKFDLIISNPPFYSAALKGENETLNLAKHVSRLTPELLFSKVVKVLGQKGVFWVIWPFEDSAKMVKKAKDNGLFLNQKIDVYGKPDVPKRVVLAFSFTDKECLKADFTVRNSEGKYTQQYIALTKGFHDREL